MLNQFSRTELLIGKNGIEKLNKSKVAGLMISGEVIKDIIKENFNEFIPN